MNRQEVLNAVIVFNSAHEMKKELCTRANASWGNVREALERAGTWKAYLGFEKVEDEILDKLGTGRYWSDTGDDLTFDVIEKVLIPIMGRLE